MVGSTRPNTEFQVDSTPELQFGLVGAVGSDVQKISRVLDKELKAVRYSSHEIRLSQLLASCHKYKNLKATHSGPEDVRIDEHMKAGDDLRRCSKRGDAVAHLAVSAVRNFREDKTQSPKQLIPRQAYIFNSLKHPDEIRTLREIYGDSFFLISVYAPESDRLENLAKRIAKSRNDRNTQKFVEVAKILVDKNSKEVGDNFGQDVRDTFPSGDIFINEKNNIRKQIRRFIEKIFGYQFTTPSVDEYGMFHAKAAALRSSDLSRQVGAVIATHDGEIVATGCNEVPKATGGSVWEGKTASDKDYRDFRLGWDTSALMQREMIAENFDKLEDSQWVTKKAKDTLSEKIAEELLGAGNEGYLRDTRLASVIEFGRIVHAEMAAISDAARRGNSVRGTTLYCTTFPCHMCARHIISTGIDRVIYIEPYPKSMTKNLYEKMVSIDQGASDDDAVMFSGFVGIAPRKYLTLFEKPERQDKKGFALDWEAPKAIPRLNPEKRIHFPAHRDLEAGFTDLLEARAEELGLIPPSIST